MLLYTIITLLPSAILSEWYNSEESHNNKTVCSANHYLLILPTNI